MSALFSTLENGSTPGGLLLADWLLCNRDAPIYVYMHQMKSFRQETVIFCPIYRRTPLPSPTNPRGIEIKKGGAHRGTGTEFWRILYIL